MYLNRMVVLFKRRYSRHFSEADRPLHKCTLLCRVTINNVPSSDFSTRQHLFPQHWDQANQCALPDCPDHEAINRALARIRHRLEVIRDRYEYDDVEITADQVVSEFHARKQAAVDGANGMPLNALDRLPKRPKKAAITFVDLLTRHLAALKLQVIADHDDREHGIVLETWKVYNRYTNNLLRYLEATKTEQQPVLPAMSLDAPWMNGLVKWMQAEEYDGYYIAKHQYYVKTTLDWAINEKLVVYSPIAAYDVERNDNEDDDLIFLYDEEIERFETTDFRAIDSVATLADTLDRVRDAWLAMAEIGQHYKDYRAFVKNSAKYLRTVKGIRFFRKRRQKTKQWALVPISDKLERLEVKYGGFEHLPTPCNKSFNIYLKVIAAVCKIPKNLTTKAARKTFADQAINEDELDLDTVARMMGLSTTQYIRKYARIDERRIIKKLGLTTTDDSDESTEATQ